MTIPLPSDAVAEAPSTSRERWAAWEARHGLKSGAAARLDPKERHALDVMKSKGTDRVSLVHGLGMKQFKRDDIVSKAKRGSDQETHAADHAQLTRELEALKPGGHKSTGLASRGGVRIERTSSGFVTVADGTRLPHKSPSAAAGHALRLHRQRAAKPARESAVPLPSDVVSEAVTVGPGQQAAKNVQRRNRSLPTRSVPRGTYDPSKHPHAGSGPGGGRFISKGASGDIVKGVQGQVGAKQSGSFDTNTAKAVRAFQQAHGLTVDGVVGAQTAGAMQGKKQAVGRLSHADSKFLIGKASKKKR